MRVADTHTISAIDKATIAAGTPGLDLMERAAGGVCETALGMLKGVRGPRVLVVCGKGNNGGDGFAAARLLARTGIQVTCLLLFARAEYRGDALRNLKRLKDTAVKTLGPLPAAQWPAFDRFHLIIDAIFGTGFSGSIKGDIRTCIGQINQSNAKVLAVDAPSGINSNTGGADGEAVFAHVTVTMGLPKIGHFFFPARVHVGELKIIDIGFSDAHVNKLCKNVFMIGPDIARAGVPARRGDEHKNQCGKVLVVAGSTGLTGAACLAARAALKSGAGVVTVAVPKSLNAVFETKLTEEMTLPLNDAGRGYLGPSHSGSILKALAGYDVLALGPGISRNKSALALARSLVQKSPVPVVLDADGIFAFNGVAKLLKKAASPVVITPHEGEFKGLTGAGSPGRGVQRIETLEKAQKSLGVGIVLKGAPTLVCFSPGITYINTTGNPGMATAGAGDVLTGLIAGFFAQGGDLFAAARTGVFVHGLAGNAAALEIGENCLTAQSLVDFLPKAFKELLG